MYNEFNVFDQGNSYLDFQYPLLDQSLFPPDEGLGGLRSSLLGVEKFEVPALTPTNLTANFVINSSFSGLHSLVDPLLGTSPVVNTQAINSALLQVGQSFEDFLQKPNYIDSLQLAFGSGWEQQIATTLIQDLAQGQNLPAIEVVTGAELQAQGAFSQQTNTIYLAQEFVQNNPTNAIATVLTEELGHYIDTQLNLVDTPGDEGQLFAAIVDGIELTPAQLQAITLEDDHKLVTINGQTLLVEQSVNEIIGTAGRDVLTGTPLSDRIIGGVGADLITGGLGADVFVYQNIRDAGDIIKDFELRQDVIDVSQVLSSFGYGGFNPIADGYIKFSTYTGGTIVLVDSDGKGSLSARPYIYVEKVTPNDLSSYPSHFIPNPGEPPQIQAGLVNDTGVSNSDRLSFDPTISGKVTATSNLISLKAGLNNQAVTVDIFDTLQPDGSFNLTTARLRQINGGSLNDGAYTLKLQATDNKGNISSVYSFNFVLDTTAPSLNLQLDPNFDSAPVGDLQTSFETVNLVGTTEANLTVNLPQIGVNSTSNNLGQFTFTNISLTPGSNLFTVIAKDLAGNQGEFSQTFQRLVQPVNTAPTNLSLNPDNSAENVPDNNIIGTFTTTDIDVADTHTYSLVTGAGDTDNTAFVIVDNQLRIKQSPDFETKSAYSVRVRTTDAGGLFFDQAFSISITNVNEAPTDILLDGDTVEENADGAVIGTISVIEPDTISAFINNTVTVNDDRFEVVNNNGSLKLKLKDGRSLNYEVETTVNLILTATDVSDSSLTYSKNFTINVTDIDENVQLPTISADIANDTGVSNSDRLTQDPTISGQTTDAITLQGNLNGNGFVDISDALNEDGSFTISLEQYEVLSNGALPDGDYTLELKAKNSSGQASEIVTVSFNLDLTPPPLTFGLAPATDTGVLGDGITSDRFVTLVGQTQPGLTVALLETQQITTADSQGNFSFTNVPMPVAGKAPFTIVAVDAAGNQGRSQEFFTREGINGAPEITSTPGSIFDTSQQTTYTYQIVATDPDGDDLTYTLLNTPQGAEIDENGLLSFTPSGTLRSFYNFSVEVSDGRGGTDSQTFTVQLPVLANLGTIRGIKWNDINGNGKRELVNFDDFSVSTSSLELGGNAAIVSSEITGGKNVVRLTPAVSWQAGNALLQNPFDIVGENGEILSFSTKFKFSISNSGGIFDSDGTGADGIAFIISPTENVGSAGGGIGYAGLINSVAVELDTFNNNALGVDSNDGNHIGININGNLASIAQTNIPTLFNNGNVWNVWIDYDGKSQLLEARVSQESDRPIVPTVSSKVNIPQILGQENIFVGFTSATGAAWGNHDILSWTFETNEPGLAGVSVYLDSNNNGQLDSGEPIQITAQDDPSTPDIDETGQYEFNNLTPGTYIVREIIPDGFEQTFPSSSTTTTTINFDNLTRGKTSGNIFADSGVLFSSAKSTGTVALNNILILDKATNDFVVEPARWSSPPYGVIATNNDDILLEFTQPVTSVKLITDIVFGDPGIDIVRLVALEKLESNKFKVLGFEEVLDNKTTPEDATLSLNLLDTPFSYALFEITTELEGFDDLTFTTSSNNFYEIVLEAGEIVENIDFGNVQIAINQDPIITSTPIIEAVVGQPYEYLVRANDPDGDPLTFSLNQAPEGMVIDPQTGRISYTPPITAITSNFDTSDSQIRPGADNQATFTNISQFNFTDAISDYAIGEGFNVFTNLPVGPVFRSAVSFDLSSLSSQVTSAKLQLLKNRTSGDPIETLGLFEVTTEINQLYTNRIGLVSPEIFEDLGTGRSYGTFDVATGGNPDEILEFELNETAIAAINAASGDFFSIGLALLSANPNNTTQAAEYLFAFSGNAGIQRLVLETENKETVEILVNDGKGGEAVQNYTLSIVESSDNQPPVITSTPTISIALGETYEYQIEATDPNADSLTYSLINFPDGMEIDEFGKITWIPTEIGEFTLEIAVSDGRGGADTQIYIIEVVRNLAEDTEAPQINFGFNSTVLKLGETLNLQIQGLDNVGLADLDVSFNGDSLLLTPNTVTNGLINTASITPNTTGVFEVVATATDFAGNTVTKTISVRVINPNDTQAPITELDLSGFDPLNAVISELTDIVGTINDPDLEFYRVELAPVSLINLSNPAANDPDYITIAEGRGSITNGVLAQIDPRLYRNDNYYIRVYAQDYSGNANVQGVVLGINSQNKPGRFALEFTDLSIPLTGIPIEIQRRYDSLDAKFSGDFGYGWSLGFQDAQIQEASSTGVDLSRDDFFGGNSFTVGTRVTLTTPDGRRVGFTFNPIPDGGGFLGVRYKPNFTPDAGVYDRLEVDYTPLTVRGNGSTGLYVFGFTYNPSQYRLITKDGTTYRYDQYQGLLDITDRNGNKLTYTDAGIFSSTGQSVNFNRDAQGRITEIIDPAGKGIIYNYDAQGNLVSVSDRNSDTTQFVYDTQLPSYLTEIIDPLGRKGTRTEYDNQGRMIRLIDAEGNALDLSYSGGASSQTIKDPLGNTLTRVFDARGNVVQEVDALGGITQRTFDNNNNVLSETDSEGNTKSYTYDSRGNKLTETDGEGNTKRYTYNARNDILTQTDALGNVTTYTYDTNGNLSSRQDTLGNVTTYKYAQNGLLTQVIDANGQISTFRYDVYGNLTELIDPTGAKTTFTHDNNGRVTSVTDALGAITNYIYDQQGRLIEKADPEGSSCGCARGITKTEYNAAGEKIAEIDALGRRTEYRYNQRGLLIEIILPDSTPDILTDNPRTKNEYDALDRLTIFTDELGRNTYYVYDALGRQIEIILPDSTPNNLTDNPRTKKEYDKAGLVIAEIDELGNRTQFEYDNADRLIKVTNALNEVTTYTYDAEGRRVSMTDALGRKTVYVYDGLDREIEVIYPDNTPDNLQDNLRSQTKYDGLGRVIAETDLAGNTTKYQYDALGRLTAVIDTLNQRTEYKYDAVGNLIEQKDANGNVTKFEYDSLRRLQATILPEGQENKTIHNKIGNLIEVTDFNGVVTTYKYNERNWLIEKSFSDGTPTETFTYTATGNLATVTDNRGVTTYTYDERDRLISRTEPDGRQIQYTYDKAGNILTLNVPSGTTTYTYDALSRIDTVKDADNGLTDYDYDAVGNLIKTLFPNGVIENQQYDFLNRLLYLENRNQTGIISSYTYTLDGIGNRLKVEENDGRIVEYSYDKLYRLTQEKITDAVAGNKTIEYQFDAVGNRLQKIDSVEGTTTYTYDDNDRLLQETLGSKVTNYQYDNEGNLIAKIENGQTQTVYEWNAKGELTAVEVTENGKTGRTEFEYDHNGIRVSINVDGEETRFLIDNNQQQYAQVIEEYQVNGDVKTTYTHGWDLISQDNGNNRIYYQVDGLGSTRQLTDNNGAIVVEYDYDAYGNLTRKVGNVDNNYLFAGEQFEQAVDGYYLRARYYDSLTGRFVSTDPFEGYNNQPITLHDYLYAGVNPVNAIDPSGELAVSEYALLLSVGVVYPLTVAGIACTLDQKGISPAFAIPLSIALTVGSILSGVAAIITGIIPAAIVGAISCLPDKK